MRVVIDTGKMAGVIVLAGGVLVLGAAIARAVLLEPAPPLQARPAVDTPEQGTPQVLITESSPAEPLSGRVISRAVSSAPFDPERRPPMQRYRLPGEQMAAEVTAPAEEPPPTPPLRVLGTIAGPSGGIAVIQAEGERPKVVSVGQMIGEYRIASIQEEVVTVSNRGWEVELALEEGTAESQSSSERDIRRAAQQAQQQALESMMRSLQQRLGGGYQIQTTGGRTYLIGPDGTRREVQVPVALVRGGRGTNRQTNTRIPPGDQPGQRDDAGTDGGGF